jgi:hypothetical protein
MGERSKREIKPHPLPLSCRGEGDVDIILDSGSRPRQNGALSGMTIQFNNGMIEGILHY